MTKEEILAAIQRAAAERGGRIGLAAFLEETGIPEKQILGKHWATWNEALFEAGVKTTSFAEPRTPEATVLEALGQFIVRLGKWPTEDQLSLERRRNHAFPSLNVLRRMLRSGNAKEKLLAHCAGREEFASVRDLVGQLPQLDTGNDLGNRAPVQGFVYMMRSGRHYKIGFTNSPNRRFREVRIELPDPTHIVHTIETDDPPGIEGYWHRRFASKRVRDTRVL